MLAPVALLITLLIRGVAATPHLTPAAAGPYRVSGNTILDAGGHAYLIRGTTLPTLADRDPTNSSGTATPFPPWSATSLITIRQRLNMNAVRVPILMDRYVSSAAYRKRARDFVDLANRLELLVILELARAASAQPEPENREAAALDFWSQLAADLHFRPNVFFAVHASPASTLNILKAIRLSGAAQPIIVTAPSVSGLAAFAATPELSGPNILYGATAHYADTQTDGDRDTLYASIAARVPLLIDDLDPQLDAASTECLSFPADPAAASRLVEDHLQFFDRHEISWTISRFEPGKLITDYLSFTGTKLDNGWTCGRPQGLPVGIGMLLLAHLWSAVDTHGLFVVNETTGGIVLSRGGIAAAYGPILADRALHAPQRRALPFSLGNVSVRVTDSRGTARRAPLLYTGAGWSNLDFIVPPASALGPASVEILRSDGSRSAASVIIGNGVAGLFTGTADSRGPVIGQVDQRSSDHITKSFSTWNCTAEACRAAPIPISPGVSTKVRLLGTGLASAGTHADVQAWIDGTPVPVVSFGPDRDPGVDQLTLALPATLAGRGDSDLYFTVNGVLSNVSRINCGAPTPKSSPGEMRLSRALLGRFLFYDKRMSLNGTTSCATCHRQELAFTDGRAQAIGATGQPHPRSAMSLVNVATNEAFNWSDPGVHSLEQQALKPMLSTAPIELGLASIRPRFLQLLRTDPTYRSLFPLAFPGTQNIYTIPHVAKALAAFERTIVSTDSPYDRFHLTGDPNAISEAAKRGEILFFQDPGPACFRCHSGSNFRDPGYHNTGLYNLPGLFSYPVSNPGLYAFTKRTTDMGKFKTPGLRNIALTAPYMHDGTIATLGEVLDHYAAGGRTLHAGPFAGIGHDNPNRDALMRGFPMTPQNRSDLIAFLESLTDSGIASDPAFSDPWPTSLP